eukprot:gene2298-8586_t
MSFISNDAFADLDVLPDIKRALVEVFRYEFMSKPQAKYIGATLDGKDVFVKARTGSGKTLGFLIPTMQAVLRYRGPYPVKALILSPSRELARQTMDEKSKLSRFCTHMCVQMITSGTNAGAERKRLLSKPCDDMVHALYQAIVKEQTADPHHKIIVFFNTAWMAHFMAELFRAASMPDALGWRLSQSRRNRIAEQFGRSNGVILFASDVIARGIDFPDVTMVVQLWGAEGNGDRHTDADGRNDRRIDAQPRLDVRRKRSCICFFGILRIEQETGP